MSRSTLRIGFSACFFHPDPARPIFRGKTLLYLEQSIADWLMQHGAVPFLVPTPTGKINHKDLLSHLDGIILQGGTDLSPTSYQEQALKPEWSGDPVRDDYELALIRQAIAMDKPVLGICRGLQLVNVAFGGALYQDIATQNPDAQTHRDAERYDQLNHAIAIQPGSLLETWYGKQQSNPRVNSVHHQGIKRLGKDLRVEALSVPDQVIEAIASTLPQRFIFAVQWHPEFHANSKEPLLDPSPILENFLMEIEKRKC